jgi:hypothetical protein
LHGYTIHPQYAPISLNQFNNQALLGQKCTGTSD